MGNRGDSCPTKHKLSRNLTLHDKRMIYLVEPGAIAAHK
jgi:hypothetical protein